MSGGWPGHLLGTLVLFDLLETHLHDFLGQRRGDHWRKARPFQALVSGLIVAQPEGRPAGVGEGSSMKAQKPIRMRVHLLLLARRFHLQLYGARFSTAKSGFDDFHFSRALGSFHLSAQEHVQYTSNNAIKAKRTWVNFGASSRCFRMLTMIYTLHSLMLDLSMT